jgi:hypothetical protein
LPTIAEPGSVEGAVVVVVDPDPDPEEISCSWDELQPLSTVAARRENARQRLYVDRVKGWFPQGCK